MNEPSERAADIVLAAVNARYAHPSFGLRCLRAQLGDLRPRSAIREFDLHAAPGAAAAELAALRPRVLGLGLYVWNADPASALVREFRRRRPETAVVVGGPEARGEADDPEAARLADVVVRGEGESAFPALCASLLAGRRPAGRAIDAPAPDLAALAPPYGEYSDDDLAHRNVYVETSRGCPFACDYCLSSVDPGVREWPLERVLPAIGDLLDRGARRLKFVDRTFNADPDRAARVLAFLFDRLPPGAAAQFELAPFRLPPALRTAIARFPPGALRFEVGVQTFDPDVAARIRRPFPARERDETLDFLCRRSGAAVHADLIAGLPGEGMESFGAGFDRLLAFGPDEIQVGILKRLRGTAIGRHDDEWGQVYRAAPPYDVLETKCLSRDEVARLSHFGRHWEVYANRQRFPRALPLLWRASGRPFDAFLAFSDGLIERRDAVEGRPLDERAEDLLRYLVDVAGADRAAAAEAVRSDWTHDAPRRVGGRLRAALEGRKGETP